MTGTGGRLILYAGMAMLSFSVGLPAQVLQEQVAELQRITVDEHLGAGLPMELEFTTMTGDRKPLESFFTGGMPVVVVLYYSNCPMLCSLVLNGLSRALPSVKLSPGEHYRLLTVSINPGEGSEHSRAGYDRFFGGLPGGTPPDAWTFLTGDSLSIALLADSLGFRFFKVQETGEYAHPAVVMITTGDGRISRYLYGIDYPPNDLRLALLEASQGRIGSTIDRIILYCFHYDPDSKGYVVLAGNVMKLGGAATVAILGLVLGGYWLGERRRRAKG